MTVTVSLNDLKKALRLEGFDSIKEWAKQLRNPEGQTVDRTNVYKALDNGSPQWLLDEIRNIVSQSRHNHPQFWINDET